MENGLVDVESFCDTDGTFGYPSSAFCYCTGCGGYNPSDPYPWGICETGRRDCLLAIPFDAPNEVRCPAERQCEVTYRDCYQNCIDTILEPQVTCPTSALNGTFVLDFSPEDSFCYYACVYKVQIPAPVWHDDVGGGVNCGEEEVTESYFEIEAWLFDNYDDDTVTLQIYVPWGPNAAPYDAFGVYENTAIQREDWCNGEPFDVSPVPPLDSYTAENLLYRLEGPDEPFFGYVCEGDRTELIACCWNDVCSKYYEGAPWDEQWPECDCPATWRAPTYEQNPSVIVEIDEAYTLDGES